MKKKILSIIVFLVLVLVTVLETSVFATTNTLEKIAKTFNESSIVKSYGELLSCEYSAVVDESEPNVLSVSISREKGISTVSYELEGSILSYEHLVDDNIFTAFFLADSIGQVNGYEDGELLNNFNMFTDEIYEYTVEDEGFEIKENGSYYSVKMDIDKKVPLIDESKFYLKPYDFDVIKQFVEEGSRGNQCGRKSKLAYDVILNEDINRIYIGEKDELTDSAYKSILSAIEVMYGDEVVEYFKTKYTEFEDGITVLDGFEVDSSVESEVEDIPMFDDMKVALVTFDNKYINDAFLRTEFVGETVDRGDKTITLDFIENKLYKIGFFDSSTSSDAAFLYKYVLEPVFIEAGDEAELEDNTAYFNIVNGKIVVGDKNNSVFKLVIADEYLEILPTKTDVEKTIVTAKHENVKCYEYDECDYAGHSHYRYGLYKNVNINVIYGNVETEETTSETEEVKSEDEKINDGKTTENEVKEVKTTNTIKNPKTGDNIIGYVAMSAISLAGIVIIVNKGKK